MKRARLWSLAAVASALPVLAGACGDEASSGDTLPPIVTTTTVPITVFQTTTTVRVFYVIQPGDTLGKIADSFGVSQDDLMALNGITDPNHIEAGDEIEIPPAKVVLDTLPPTTSTVQQSTVSP